MRSRFRAHLLAVQENKLQYNRRRWLCFNLYTTRPACFPRCLLLFPFFLFNGIKVHIKASRCTRCAASWKRAQHSSTVFVGRVLLRHNSSINSSVCLVRGVRSRRYLYIVRTAPPVKRSCAICTIQRCNGARLTTLYHLFLEHTCMSLYQAVPGSVCFFVKRGAPCSCNTNNNNSSHA